MEIQYSITKRSCVLGTEETMVFTFSVVDSVIYIKVGDSFVADWKPVVMDFLRDYASGETYLQKIATMVEQNILRQPTKNAAACFSFGDCNQ